MTTDDLEIVQASAGQIHLVQSLWRNYWDSLGLEDDFQDFEKELRALPGLYAPPAGRLLIVLRQVNAVGTAALRPLDQKRCEAKRLYLSPIYQGKGIGSLLLARLLLEARLIGYREVYGDTLPAMTSALRMYRRFGFTEVGPYSATPTPGAVFLKLTLDNKKGDSCEPPFFS